MNLLQLKKTPFKLARKMKDEEILQIFNDYKNDVYPLNHGKFESLQYLDSIRPQEEIKFEKIENVIKDFKKEIEEEEKKKMEELQRRFISRLA